ncbi:MAG: MinD/ParA family ATP-binding protein [Hyphomicrobiaceae bacterium]
MHAATYSDFPLIDTELWMGVRRRLPAVLIITLLAGLLTFGSFSLARSQNILPAHAATPGRVEIKKSDRPFIISVLDALASPGAQSREKLPPLKKVPTTLLVMLLVLVAGLLQSCLREANGVRMRRLIERERAVGNGDEASREFSVAENEDGSISQATSVLPNDTLDRITTHLVRGGKQVSGFRTILTGANETIDPTYEGLALASRLSRCGANVALLDWNDWADGFSHLVGLPQHLGLRQVISENVDLEEVITQIPGSRVHYLSAGSGQIDKLDGNALNALLDELDEIYDQVLVVGRYHSARGLFEAVQGRFDAGVEINTVEREPEPEQEKNRGNVYIGFEVDGLSLYRHQRILEAIEDPTKITDGQSQLP